MTAPTPAPRSDAPEPSTVDTSSEQLSELVTALTHEVAVLLRNPCESDDRHVALVHRCAVRLSMIRDDLRVLAEGGGQ